MSDAPYQKAVENSIGFSPEIGHFVMVMTVWSRLEDGQKFQNGVVTIGNFDGLHLGHQTLLKTARGAGKPVVVISFDPHPMQVLYPERGLRKLFPREDLREQLPRYGVDLLLLLPFSRELAALSAEEFLRTYVATPFAPRVLTAGYDFSFGRGREGTLEVLKSFAANNQMRVEIEAPLKVDGEIASSRRVRELVAAGEMEKVRALLGRPFYLRGEVVAGAGRGATIGVATLNQKVVNETLPAGGVYATRARLGDEVYKSVTNIGVNPTFESGIVVKVETHVLDARVDWRGKTIDVEFLKRLRGEKKFSGAEELVAQIKSDMEEARKI